MDAEAIGKGTNKNRANVWENKVLPETVGTSRRILDIERKTERLELVS